ncbi:hypothetical protein [Streptomyces sp. NPDC003832]
MSLAQLGLSTEQERLYRYLLRTLNPDLDGARAELGMPEPARVLDELRELGLVDRTATAVTPAAAVDLLVRRRMAETQRRLTELSVAWDVLSELTEEHRSGRSVQMVEHLTDGSSVSRRIEDLLGGEPREFVHMKRRAREQSNKVYDPAPFRRLLAAGLRSRTLFAAEALEDPEQAAYARSSHAMGDLHRVTVEPFRHLAVVNGSVAFVQADPADPFAGALQIRQPGVVAMLADVFEGMWARARELDDLPLSPIEQRVLRALTEHGTDEAGARSLNVSVRKFRSHVADLMARLGASTRFQAALRAKELGWL